MWRAGQRPQPARFLRAISMMMSDRRHSHSSLTLCSEAGSQSKPDTPQAMDEGLLPAHELSPNTTVLKQLIIVIAEGDGALQGLQSARGQDEFFAALAHELRNPLASIRSAVQIMRLSECDWPTASAACEMIERQLKHMAQLIDELLDLSRITQGKLRLHRARVNLATVIASAMEATRPLLESKQQHVDLEWPEEPLYVEADASRLAQVFANLLNNSAKFSDSHASIRIRAVREGRVAAVTVTDRGIGIAREMLPRVFDLFERTQHIEGAHHIGLGLGLAIVKRLIELQGGTVSAHSEGPGTGSSFTVRLARLDVVDTDTGPPPRPPEFIQGGHPPVRVLVADDNRDTARSLSHMLALRGHEVRTAYDGVEALQIAEKFHPELVLLDIGMPKLDGYETARRLRLCPGGESMMLIAQSGWDGEDDKRRAREAGFDHHWVKPLDPEALNRWMGSIFESKRN